MFMKSTYPINNTIINSLFHFMVFGVKVPPRAERDQQLGPNLLYACNTERTFAYDLSLAMQDCQVGHFKII